MQGEGLQELVDGLADTLGRSVAIDDPNGGYGFLMALTRHAPPPYDGLESADLLMDSDPSGALLETCGPSPGAAGHHVEVRARAGSSRRV